jgi:phenylalanyl-tRNA synthetase beta chain
MRVPLSWLRDYVDFDLEPEALAERLFALGMEVQGIERVGEDWQSVVVGELLEVEPHPRADRLLLAQVRVDEASPPVSIVCGATNIAVGQRVPVALPGAVLPGGRQIGVSRIQGQESQGMLCSGHELGLTDDADGILILAEAGGDGAAPGGDGAAPGGEDGAPALGRPLEEVVGDVVLDIDVKPNRGDALSLIGLAREVAAVTGGRVRWPLVEVPESGDATSDRVRVTVEDPDLAPRFVARYVDQLKVRPSPLQVQLRLNAAGVRTVSNIVDASNYVMLELGKPIHTFDAASVSEGHIIVRRARDGEEIETLDHVRRELSPDTLLITDPMRPLGIAGVMGGADSEVGPGTKAVVIESAVFAAQSIRRTAQRFGLRSEASLRFEKGQEPRLARLGADRTAQLLCAWAGGRAAAGVIDTNPAPDQPRRVVFRPSRISRLLGDDIDAREMSELLQRVEIATEPPRADDQLVIVEGDGATPPADAGADAFVAVVPPHRRDVAIEADVAEEVARLRGYETLPSRLPDTEMPDYRPDAYRFTDALRDLLAGRGLAEVVTNGLISTEEHARLGYAADDETTIRITNPVAADHSELRRSLLPGLVRVVTINERQRRDDLAIFEVGPVHAFEDGAPIQRERVGIMLTGSWQPASWTDPRRDAGIDDAKGIVELLVDRMCHLRVDYEEARAMQGVEHPGRTAVVSVDSDGERVTLGRVGELNPRYLAASEVRAERVAFAMLDVAVLRSLEPARILVPSLPRLPASERDLAIVVPRQVSHGQVASVIRANAGPLLDSLALFDRYQGPPLGADELSLAYRLRFQPVERPLAENELDETIEGISRALEEQLGLRVRGPDPEQAG